MTKNKENPKEEKTILEQVPEVINGIAHLKTISGYELELRPINLLDLNRARVGVENQYKADGKILEPPKLHTPVAGGGEGPSQDVTAEMIAELQKSKEAGTVEEIMTEEVDRVLDAWILYHETMTALMLDTSASSNRVYFEAVLNWPEMKPDLSDPEKPIEPEWIRKREKMFITDVPPLGDDGDEYERRLYWLLQVCLVLPSEFIKFEGVITYISSEGAMKWEDVGAIADSFRDSIRGIVADREEEDSESND